MNKQKQNKKKDYFLIKNKQINMLKAYGFSLEL